MSPQRLSHWAGMPLELLVNSRSSFWTNGMLNVPGMVAPTNSFGAQQREITISRKSGAFVPLKVSAREREVIFARVQRIVALRRSVLTGLVFDPFSNRRATLTLPFKLSTQRYPCFPSHRAFFLLTQLLNWGRKEKIQSKPQFLRNVSQSDNSSRINRLSAKIQHSCHLVVIYFLSTVLSLPVKFHLLPRWHLLRLLSPASI